MPQPDGSDRVDSPTAPLADLEKEELLYYLSKKSVTPGTIYIAKSFYEKYPQLINCQYALHNGETTLMSALFANNISYAELLLDLGADVTIKNLSGQDIGDITDNRSKVSFMASLFLNNKIHHIDSLERQGFFSSLTQIDIAEKMLLIDGLYASKEPNASRFLEKVSLTEVESFLVNKILRDDVDGKQYASQRIRELSQIISDEGQESDSAEKLSSTILKLVSILDLRKRRRMINKSPGQKAVEFLRSKGHKVSQYEDDRSSVTTEDLGNLPIEEDAQGPMTMEEIEGGQFRETPFSPTSRPQEYKNQFNRLIRRIEKAPNPEEEQSAKLSLTDAKLKQLKEEFGMLEVDLSSLSRATPSDSPSTHQVPSKEQKEHALKLLDEHCSGKAK